LTYFDPATSGACSKDPEHHTFGVQLTPKAQAELIAEAENINTKKKLFSASLGVRHNQLSVERLQTLITTNTEDSFSLKPSVHFARDLVPRLFTQPTALRYPAGALPLQAHLAAVRITLA
jgi:hypothetical protein